MIRSASLSIVVLFAAAVFGPLTILAVTATLTHQYIHDDARRRVVRSTELLREHALRVFDMYQLILGQVERQAGTQPWRALVASRAMHEELKSLSDPVREANSTFYLAPTGLHFASSRRFPMPQFDARDRDYFVSQRDRPSAFYVGEPSTGRLTGQAFFAVTRARLDAGGAFDGVFGVSADVAYFREFYRGLRESDLDVIGMMRADGVQLVREPPPPDGGYRLGKDSGFMLAMREAPSGVFTAVAELDRVERIYAYSKVGDYPIYVAYGLSLRSVGEQWRRSLTVYSLVTLIAIAMLLVAAEMARRGSQRAIRAGREREEQLRLRERAEEGLRRSQRLEAVGRMTGGIAHDFNNLLQILLVNIEVLRKRLDEHAGERLDDVHLRPLAAMERAANQGARLTRQLLSFSRRSSLKPRLISLSVLLPDLSELLRAALRSRIEYVLEVAADIAPVEIDPDELELALLNLTTNARHAMPDGGRFTLAAHNVPAGTVVDGEALASAWVAIALTDTGNGMSLDTLNNIFDPFFTTKPAGQGTGLGLSQVYGFVTQSGGRVTVRSTLGEGSCFTLLFPPAPDAGPSDEPAVDSDLPRKAAASRELLRAFRRAREPRHKGN